MKRLEMGMIWLFSASLRVAFITSTMLSLVPTIVPAQSLGTTIERGPDANELATTSSGDKGNIQTNTPVEPVRLTKTEVEVERLIEVETQRQFNEVYRKLLDDRADTIDWWLTAMTVGLGFFALVAVVGGYIGFRRFREIEVEAKENATLAATYAREAQRLLREIERNRDKSEDMLRNQTAESADENPEEAKRTSDKVLESLQASPIAKAIARALSFQREGKKGKAIEKWRSIALVAEESNQDLATRAWFSVGYLLSDTNPAKAIEAYDEVIRRDTSNTKAYNNRGNAKDKLGRHEEAILDFDKAIRLDPDFAMAYANRGIPRVKLRRFEEASADFDKAIRLDPDLAMAYVKTGYLEGDVGQGRGGDSRL